MNTVGFFLGMVTFVSLASCTAHRNASFVTERNADGSEQPAEQVRTEGKHTDGIETSVNSPVERDCSENEISQPKSSLCWTKCKFGEELENGNCSGMPKRITWKRAKSECPDGSRLPMRAELVSLFDGCNELVATKSHGRCNSCEKSVVCNSIFSGDTGTLWSSESVVNALAMAWIADFHTGEIVGTSIRYEAEVRCVRELIEENSNQE